ncbi:MAG: 3-oxoacyl-[acyl-carrier-protein] synthase III C-terminal domain-containing protein [archaeon]
MDVNILSIEFELGDKEFSSKSVADKFGRGEDYLQKVGTKKLYKLSNKSIEEVATIVSNKAIISAKIHKGDIKAIFATTCCNTCEFQMPGLASIVGNKLGLEKIPMITLSMGCAGGVHALESAFNFLIKREKIDKEKGSVLIIAGDQFSRAAGDFSNTKAIFSDAISATIISNSKKGSYKLSNVRSSNLSGNLLSMKIQNPIANKKIEGVFLMEGKEVLKFASEQVLPEALRLAKISKMNSNLYIIPHQASGIVVNSIKEKAGLTDEQFYSLGVGRYGNTTGASVFISLKDVIENNLADKRDILLIGFGAELAVGIALLKKV